jgi:protein gp37
VTKSPIEWTDRSDWNPVCGGKLIEERLTMPLRWKKPAKCFANSTTLLIGEENSDLVLKFVTIGFTGGKYND